MNDKLNHVRRAIDQLRGESLSGGKISLDGLEALKVGSTDDGHVGGHCCPWHTCQGTRH